MNEKKRIILIATVVITAMVLMTSSVLAAIVVAPELKLPYPGGESWVITQGYNTGFTHNGIDKFALDFTLLRCDAYDRPILAVASGTVIEVDSGHVHGENNYGNKVIIEHIGGYTSLYGHLNQILVQENQRVVQGMKIGTAGNTGFSPGTACDLYPGTHLHFRMLNETGQPYKPEPMSTHTNFVVEEWYLSDNYEPTRTHPSGTLIFNSTSDQTFLLENGNKNPIPTDNVSNSWNLKPEYRITLSNKEIAKYPEGPILVFREGTLLGNHATGERYVVEHGEKKLITSNEVFIQLGYDPANVIWLTNQEEFNLCPDGEPIYFQEGTVWHSRGTLISSGSDVYKVLGGQLKRLVPTANVFDARFGDWNRIVTVTESQLNQYTTAPLPFDFPDGALILYGFDLYVIAEKQKRHIQNEEIRDIMGYTWPPIEIIEDEFNLHQQGEDITKKNSVKYKYIYVPDHYSTIQEAVDNAEEEDTIIVREGIYTENVNINTNHLTIKSENGAETTIVQAENPYENIFEITADYVNVNGFTLTGGAMIDFNLHGDYCNISGNIVTNNNDGIRLYLSNGNTISSNIISENARGICLYSSNDNTISNNIANNNDRGIRLSDSNDNTIFNNIASNNDYGIDLIFNSDNNIIYLNNFIDNTHNVDSYDDLTNTWNSPNQITYTYNGNTHTSYLGNHWDDYTNTDSNNDGIWDNPYNIDSGADNYPLVEPFENYLLQEPSTLEIIAFCPVNLSVVDPDGLTINIETNEIPEATYAETDINGDGDPDDTITVPNRKIGNYEITVIPELDAEPKETFTLQVSSNETLFFLAENVSISNIPNNPYTIEANETGISIIPQDPAIYVPDDYPTIQSAINNASEGDTVIVREGIYNENVNINKRLTLIGEGEVIVKPASNRKHIFKIAADYVNITGFCVKGAKAYAGIYLSWSDYSTIENIETSNNRLGIRLFHSTNNIIKNSSISENGYGIYLSYSDYNSIKSNVVENNRKGIYTYNSGNNKISNNNVSDNKKRGIYLYSSENTSITENTISENRKIGICLFRSKNCSIYRNNLIRNRRNAYEYPCKNANTFWDNGEEGNYYSDYMGIDSDNDGIWDEPYTIYRRGGKDNYPLAEPLEG